MSRVPGMMVFPAFGTNEKVEHERREKSRTKRELSWKYPGNLTASKRRAVRQAQPVGGPFRVIPRFEIPPNWHPERPFFRNLCPLRAQRADIDSRLSTLE